MSPLDRIEQLNKEGNTLRDEIALLRSQLKEGQDQAKRDSATIKRLSEQGESFWQDLKQFYAQ